MNLGSFVIRLVAVLLLLVIGSPGVEAAEWHSDRPSSAWIETDAVLHVPYSNTLWKDWLFAGSDGRIQVYDGTEEIAELTGFSGRVTAMASGDFFGTGDFYLAAATDSGGAVHFFEVSNGNWAKHGNVQYFWTPVHTLAGIESPDRGSAFLVGLDQEGTLSVFQYQRFAEQMFQLIWRSQPQERVEDLVLADLTNNGTNEIIYGNADGYMAVLTITNGDIRKISERYSQGSLILLAAGSYEEDQLGFVSQITKMHDSDLLHVFLWHWSETGLTLDREYTTSDWKTPMGWLPSDRVLWTANEQGTVFLSWSGTDFTSDWGLSGVAAEAVLSYRQWWLLNDRDNGWLEWVDQVRANDLWSLMDKDQERSLRLDVLAASSSPLVPMTVLAEWFGLTWDGTQIGSTAYPGTSALELQDEYVIYGQNVLLPLSAMPTQINGDWYGPLEIFHYLGWTVHIDHEREEIHFHRRPLNLDL